MGLKTNTMSSTLAVADNIRVLAASMVEKASSGHPGGPMGGADFVSVLYSEYLNYDPDDMTWAGRDRFYLDAGHMSAMLYGVQCILGNYSIEDVKNFRQWGSVTPGHPELDVKRGIENTSGPLGLGHAFGVGASIAERFMHARFGDVAAHKSYIYISDGGVQEEISQGVGRIAGLLGLGNVIMFYDANDIQLSSVVSDVMNEDTAMKYESWGWHVITIDGNDHDEIRRALDESLAMTDKPSLIIGKTVMGKSVRKEDGSLYEGEVELHGKPLSKSAASYEATMKGLGVDSADPFHITDEVSSYITTVLDQKREAAKKKKETYSSWKASNAALAAKYERFLSGEVQNIDWKSIPQKYNTATRNASAQVLSYLADHCENMIVSSADLCNSDKTEAFLKKTTIFQKGDFSGAFLQAGVSELTMAALMIGMSLHGGVIPVCATFFAFSDYMKPAIRVAALMETPLIFLWTHDAFRVGEDGPTHQPIEQEAQLRLLEKLKNHSGHNSFLAMRPADSDETTQCWKMAFENRNTPSGLILSRQNINDIASESGNRFDTAEGAHKGAYIVKSTDGNPDVVLIANGSEVSTLMDGAALLAEDGIHAQVVSVPSEGLFRSQDADYQDKILPAGIKRFGLTAGLSTNMESLVGHNGSVWGLNHFGYSAPYTVLDEKFGFTGENVKAQVKALLA